MRPRVLTLLALSVTVLDVPSIAEAGMPSVSLSDLARMRVQTISFFLTSLLVFSWMIQHIWNFLRHDFPALPRLSYQGALGVVSLWGLLFLLVLTMISGARELMTPGAWSKIEGGYTFRITAAEATDLEEQARRDQDAERRRSLERLREALWQFAQEHDGRFPTDVEMDQISEELWRVPDPSGMRYLYVDGKQADVGASPLAYEPGLFGDERLVLWTDGAIQGMPLTVLQRVLDAEKP